MIRPATLADLPAFLALEQSTATAAHWSVTQYQEVFSAAPPRIALVTEAEAIQGFLIARAVGDEWEIENIVVATAVRRRGLANGLVAELLNAARARGATAIFLEVRESNLAARYLYQKWRFLESGRRQAYYRDPHEAAITLRLDLF